MRYHSEIWLEIEESFIDEYGQVEWDKIPEKERWKKIENAMAKYESSQIDNAVELMIDRMFTTEGR